MKRTATTAGVARGRCGWTREARRIRIPGRTPVVWRLAVKRAKSWTRRELQLMKSQAHKHGGTHEH